MASLTSSRLLAPIGTAGNLFAFGLDVARNLFKRPFQLREFIQQAWFIASVTIIPTWTWSLVAGLYGVTRATTRWSPSTWRSIPGLIRPITAAPMPSVSVTIAIPAASRSRRCWRMAGR